VTGRHAGPALAVTILAAGLVMATAGARILEGTGPVFPTPPEATRRSPAPVVPAMQGARVDLNRDGADALARLPGVGPALAARIVAHRAARGPFRSPEALREVPGIGPARWERLRRLVRAELP
jgi:competence protein ComEA